MSNEWYTPSKYIEAAREVMGSIDLDPASCALANETVQATTYYTKEQDGLALPWYGNVWLNPPYSCPKPWITKFHTEDIQCVILVTTSTDTSWFQPLWEYPLCFLKGRINFDSMGLVTYSNSRYGSCFAYKGQNKQKFRNIFSQFGHVIMPERISV